MSPFLLRLDWQCNLPSSFLDKPLKVAAKTLESFDEPDADKCAELCGQ